MPTRRRACSATIFALSTRKAGSEANTALEMSGHKDLIVSELQPGLTKKMVTAFEMPDATARGTFTLVIPEKGLLGTGSVRITLK
jgi:hypothetical protein